MKKILSALFLFLSMVMFNHAFAIGENAGDVPQAQSAQSLLVDQQVSDQTQVWKTVNYGPLNVSMKGAKVFGQQVFTGGFAGVRADGLNSSYKIVPGDQVVVRVWGSFEMDRVLPVDAQGNIFIPSIGPVFVQGVMQSQLNQKVTAAIKTIYTDGASVYTQLQGVQPVSVFVTGFVNKPGRYAGTPTDSVIYFLNQAQGINADTGSYRDISVMRKGEKVASFDLYQFLVAGALPQLQLQEGDTIVVAQRGAVVSVVDASQKPMLYELNAAQEAGAELFNYVVLGAGVSHVLMQGFNQAGPVSEYLSLEDFKARMIQNGDQIVFAQDQRAQTILVQVEGSYLGKSHFILPKNAKLRELLANIAVDDELTATESVSIRRKSVAEQQKASLDSSLKRLEQTYLTATSSTAEEASIRVKEAELIMGFVRRAAEVKPNGRLVVAGNDGVANIRLQDGDVITLPTKSESVLVSGQVLVPTSLVYQQGWTLQDYINKTGGFTEQADEDKIVLIRQSGEVLADSSAVVKPGDEILVLPKVPTKNIQLATSVSQILYQIAIAAKVAFDL
ncbi:capreomycidine hydroxylase [Thiosulfatimonas sediminis]|uniref:Capreomycidine hydroxylase n=1 Tax=Thiosulfatimonas sediminis TaxID=2675054 RepID=A0A6F8PVM5_9GAMM|nr:polysaccharide biosynthesis/export family protein [Thiosulfatimonas sediminis]BBP46175.1 capreomycidine hydroxylase [Thiosulfatimonas sediminis]